MMSRGFFISSGEYNIDLANDSHFSWLDCVSAEWVLKKGPYGAKIET